VALKRLQWRVLLQQLQLLSVAVFFAATIAATVAKLLQHLLLMQS